MEELVQAINKLTEQVSDLTVAVQDLNQHSDGGWNIPDCLQEISNAIYELKKD